MTQLHDWCKGVTDLQTCPSMPRRTGRQLALALGSGRHWLPSQSRSQDAASLCPLGVTSSSTRAGFRAVTPGKGLAVVTV